jgi:hypothetical protein
MRRIVAGQQLQEITGERRMSLSRQQLTLIGIFALFLGPVILVMLMRSSWWQYQPATLKNNGHLVQPPVQLALQQSATLSGRWTILYVPEQPCEQACLDHAATLRQIHTAAGRNRDKLNVALLHEEPLDATLRERLISIYPAFELLSETMPGPWQTLSSVNAQLPADANGPVSTYVLDPVLNVVLAYRAGEDPNGIHKDLRRLLKYSDKEGS